MTTIKAKPYQITDLTQAPYSFPKEDPATLAYKAALSYAEENANATPDVCAAEVADLTITRTTDEETETISFTFGYTTSGSIQFPFIATEEK